MRRLCSVRNETLISKDQKFSLLQKLAGSDHSMEGEKVRIYCKYALPE
jgi:hypothetical protein